MNERIAQHFARYLAAALLLALVALSPAVRGLAERQSEREPLITSGELAKRNSSAFAMILDQFRASLADLMFVKTERYLDQGIAYLPHINILQMATQQNASVGMASNVPADAGGQNPDEAHKHPATIIRTTSADFRGFLGDLEREVKPWRDPRLPHHHTSGEELLPWYRLATLANPHLVRAYLVGAMWLSQQANPAEEISFLREGIANNPGNPQLFRLYVALTTAYARARWHGLKGYSWQPQALAAAKKAAEFGLAERKKDVGAGPLAKPTDQWSEDEEEDFVIGTHWVALLEQLQGQNQEALRSARELQKLAPNFAPNNHLLKELDKGNGR